MIILTRKNIDINVKTTPHFDGEKESILNDPTASAGSKLGIQVSAKEEFSQESSMYFPKMDKEMQQFEKLMRGRKIED